MTLDLVLFIGCEIKRTDNKTKIDKLINYMGVKTVFTNKGHSVEWKSIPWNGTKYLQIMYLLKI